MNKLRIFLVLLLGTSLLLGCHNWNEPEFDPNEWDPTGLDYRNFWTIDNPDADNNQNALWKHRLDTINWNPSPDSLRGVNTPKRYIKAVVVSSDEGGNYYKSMVIQDETGGVELELDMAGLYTQYPVGQKIVLECNGLVVGDYNGLPQIGWIYNGNQVGRINSLNISKYIKRDGVPSLANLPEILTNDKIDFYSSKDINKLVRLEGVRFQEEAIGEPIAYNHFQTEWKITGPGIPDNVVVRTSNYAKFRSMIIQDKEYNLTGILTIYQTNQPKYQLMIRTREDIVTLNPDILEFDFSKNPIGEGKWSVYPSTSNSKWVFREEAMAHIYNNPSTYKEMDDWLISPVITLEEVPNGSLRIFHQINVQNGEYDAYQVYYTTSTSEQFNINDWKKLNKLENFPASYDWSNPISLSEIKSKTFRIAFRYLSNNPNIETYRWDIKKVEIKNQ